MSFDEWPAFACGLIDGAVAGGELANTPTLLNFSIRGSPLIAVKLLLQFRRGPLAS